MVYHGRISPEIRAFIKLDRESSAKKLGKDLGVSLAQVYRIKKEPLRHVSRKKDSSKNVSCRPEKLDDRTKRHLIREVHNLRKREPNWTVKRLMEAADIKNISRRTVSRFLNKNGYNYLQARRKGLMSDKDRRARVAFAKKVVKEHGQTFWSNKIAFYLDGVSFAYTRGTQNLKLRHRKAEFGGASQRGCSLDVLQKAVNVAQEEKWFE